MKKCVEFKKPYGERKRYQKSFVGESLTKQSFKDECDINNILKKYQKTGLLEHVRNGGSYADISTIGDYRHCLDVVNQAEELFDALPSKLRSRFANDPYEMIQFVQNPKNRLEAEELGLVEKQNIQNSDVKSETKKTE